MTEHIVFQVAWLLLGAALIGMLAYWLKIPYAIALVVSGLVIGQSQVLVFPQLQPQLVLFAFLPPLLFDAAYRFDAAELRATYRPILILAVPGVLATTVLVGLVVMLGLHLPLIGALLFGSIVAATDPVAVIAVFKQLKAPARLAAIAEGESLVNDGMAITLYAVLIEVAVTGHADLPGAVLLFGREVFGGVLIGAAAGLIFSRLTALVDDDLVEMTLSTALAYGSYLVAQTVEASGPLACVTAGLIHGTYGRRIGMSERTRHVLDELWEYLGFLANGLLFLLVGLTVNVGSLLEHAWPVAIAIVAVVATRPLVIGAAALLMPRNGMSTTHGERGVLAWGGLRGALTVALALALPSEVPARDLLVTMAVGVDLFTLVVQGLTLPLVLRWFGLVPTSSSGSTQERDA
jgi:CPA1 family monovalent cation:H+ antiporter